MNHCATCQHFDPPTGCYDFGYGTCNLLAGDGGGPVTDIKVPLGTPMNVKPEGWPLAFAADCSSYAASFHVHPDFGCILHVPIPDPDVPTP